MGCTGVRDVLGCGCEYGSRPEARQTSPQLVWGGSRIPHRGGAGERRRFQRRPREVRDAPAEATNPSPPAGTEPGGDQEWNARVRREKATSEDRGEACPGTPEASGRDCTAAEGIAWLTTS